MTLDIHIDDTDVVKLTFKALDAESSVEMTKEEFLDYIAETKAKPRVV